jgi:hypothetical protein
MKHMKQHVFHKCDKSFGKFTWWIFRLELWAFHNFVCTTNHWRTSWYFNEKPRNIFAVSKCCITRRGVVLTSFDMKRNSSFQIKVLIAKFEVLVPCWFGQKDCMHSRAVPCDNIIEIETTFRQEPFAFVSNLVSNLLQFVTKQRWFAWDVKHSVWTLG